MSNLCKGLITELMKGLGSLMRRRDPKTHKSEDDSGDLIDAMASILTPFDETQVLIEVLLDNFNLVIKFCCNFVVLGRHGKLSGNLKEAWIKRESKCLLECP